MVTVCRLCLNREPFGLDLFCQLAKEKEICKKIGLCIPAIQVSEDDFLPRNICYKCVSKLEATSEFIRQCTLSENLLRQGACTNEGEPSAKARKTNVFSSLNGSEPGVNETILFKMKGKSDDSFDEIDIPHISDSFKKSYLNGNCLTAKVYNHKENEGSTVCAFRDGYEVRMPLSNSENKAAAHNWKNERPNIKRDSGAAWCDTRRSNSPVSKLHPQLPHSPIGNARSQSMDCHNGVIKDLQKNKCQRAKKTTDYLKLQTENGIDLLRATEYKSPEGGQKAASSLSTMLQPLTSSINRVNYHSDNDSDEEINRHFKIMNSIRNMFN